MLKGKKFDAFALSEPMKVPFKAFECAFKAFECPFKDFEQRFQCGLTILK